MSDDEKAETGISTETIPPEAPLESSRAISRPTLHHPLSRDTDHVARPGFRNPPNQGSKALKKPKRR